MCVPVRYGSFAISTSPSAKPSRPCFAMPALDRVREHADEERHARRLGPEPAVGGDDAEPEVLDVVEERVVRRPDERPVHLARSRTTIPLRTISAVTTSTSPVSAHRPPCRARGCRAGRRSALQPGGTTVVVVHSSTIAGPSRAGRGPSASRSKTGVSTQPRPGGSRRTARRARRGRAPSTVHSGQRGPGDAADGTDARGRRPRAARRRRRGRRADGARRRTARGRRRESAGSSEPVVARPAR